MLIFIRLLCLVFLVVLPAFAVETGGLMRFGGNASSKDSRGEVDDLGASVEFDPVAEMRKLLIGRPTIGWGSVNIFMFVDFNDPRSLQMLGDLLGFARKNLFFKIIAVYYAPLRPMHDQGLATFSTIVNKVATPRRHLIYLENMIKYRGKKDAVARSIKAAGIPVRSVQEHSKAAMAIIEENNRVGYRVSRANRAPVMIIGSKVICSYLSTREIKAVLQYALKNKRVLQGPERPLYNDVRIEEDVG